MLLLPLLQNDLVGRRAVIIIIEVKVPAMGSRSASQISRFAARRHAIAPLTRRFSGAITGLLRDRGAAVCACRGFCGGVEICLRLVVLSWQFTMISADYSIDVPLMLFGPGELPHQWNIDAIPAASDFHRCRFRPARYNIKGTSML